MTMHALAVCGFFVGQTPTAAPPPAAPAAESVDWGKAEAPFLTNQHQLTTREQFLKAGEAYFDHEPDGDWIIFQAIPVPKPGEKPQTNYSMYVARLLRHAYSGPGIPVEGLEDIRLISPPGSANTCGWFHPTNYGQVIFGSTMKEPVETDSPGYSRDRQRYAWSFPKEMDIVTVGIKDIWRSQFYRQVINGPTEPAQAPDIFTDMSVHPLITRPGYDAECSFSHDGRFILYTHVDPSDNDPNIWVYDTKTKADTPLVTAKGYDGGPFFSPDDKFICYRSDRVGNNVLQLFTARLVFADKADPARITAIADERQLTFPEPGKKDEEQVVSWCPYFHPSGTYLVYATSKVGHDNYEVYAMQWAPGPTFAALRSARVTYAPGFDGLPVFSDDGHLMMWTSQRGPKAEGEARPSSQIWIANVTGEPAWETSPAAPIPTAVPPAPEAPAAPITPAHP